MYSMYNNTPVMPNMQYSQYNNYIPRHEVGRVSGEAGAWAAPMAPNSSDIFLDELAPLAYLVQTDSANNRTVSPFNVSPYIKEPEVTMDDIITRLEKLEGKLNEQSDVSDVESTASNESAANTKRSKSTTSKTSVE